MPEVYLLFVKVFHTTAPPDRPEPDHPLSETYIMHSRVERSSGMGQDPTRVCQLTNV